MTVQFQESNGVLVFKVPARVDVSNTAELVTPIHTQIAAGNRQLALDLSQTETIDSTALGALVQIFKQLKSRGGTLVLVGVGDTVRRVFSLTRLDTVFVQSATLDEALRLLQAKRQVAGLS